MRIFRALGFRLVIVVVVLLVIGAGWAVNRVMRSQARGDAQKTVSWFYDDARYEDFSQFVSSNGDYLAEAERAAGQDIETAFSWLDRDDFANEFQSTGLMSPEQLVFKVDKLTEQDNDGNTAHVLVNGAIRPADVKRGKTNYQFSDDTFEPFTHLVTLTKNGGSWYIASVEPHN